MNALTEVGPYIVPTYQIIEEFSDDDDLEIYQIAL